MVRGKKIEEWKFQPNKGEIIDVEVRLNGARGEQLFHASWMADGNWMVQEHSDINTLYKTVALAIAARSKLTWSKQLFGRFEFCGDGLRFWRKSQPIDRTPHDEGQPKEVSLEDGFGGGLRLRDGAEYGASIVFDYGMYEVATGGELLHRELGRRGADEGHPPHGEEIENGKFSYHVLEDPTQAALQRLQQISSALTSLGYRFRELLRRKPEPEVLDAFVKGIDAVLAFPEAKPVETRPSTSRIGGRTVAQARKR